MNLSWRKLAVVGAVIGLLALAVHPAVAGLALAAALVLTPVLLFGLVLMPLSLWPAADLNHRHAVPVLRRAVLFQRPPPFSIR